MTDNEPRIIGATDPDQQELVHTTAIIELFRAPVEALANLATAQQEELKAMSSRLSEIEAALSRLDDTVRDQIAVEVSREVESELEDLDISTQVQDHLNEIITEAVASELNDVDWSDHIMIANA